MPVLDDGREAVSLIGVRRPWAVLLVTLACTLLLAAGGGRLTFDPRYSTFFEADDPQLRAFEARREVFAPSDAVAFVVEAPMRIPGNLPQVLVEIGEIA